MPISYQAALRIFAKKNGKFVVPKKGSSEYDEVRKIMGETEMSSEHEIKRRSKKTLKTGVPVEGEVVMKKKRNARMKKSATSEQPNVVTNTGKLPSNLPPPHKVDTAMIDEPENELKDAGPVVKKPLMKKKKVAGKGVNRTGKSTAQNDTEMLINSNTGPSAAISAELPDQKERIKKAVKRGKKDDTFIEVEQAKDKTIKNMKTDDAVAIEGDKVQFSFQALRNRLLC